MFKRGNMNLEEYFRLHRKAAIAFSGGVDSSYLMYAASRFAQEVKAYYVKTAFQPAFELADAKRLAASLSVPLKIITLDILSFDEVAANPANRCYYCKHHLFEAIIQAAREDGFDVVMDGTNASDQADDRPGMRALQELSVQSPLRICGLTKQEIRDRSKEAGLFTWNKPAYACLATSIRTGEKITASMLKETEKSENFLYKMGFRDFRVRRCGDTAKIQVCARQLPMVLENRGAVRAELGKYYKDILLDLKARDEI